MKSTITSLCKISSRWRFPRSASGYSISKYGASVLKDTVSDYDMDYVKAKTSTRQIMCERAGSETRRYRERMK